MRLSHTALRIGTSLIALLVAALPLHAQKADVDDSRKLAKEILDYDADPNAAERATKFLKLTESRTWTYNPDGRKDREHEGAYLGKEKRSDGLWAIFTPRNRGRVPLKYVSEADRRLMEEIDALQIEVKRDHEAVRRAAAKAAAERAAREEAERRRREEEARARERQLAEELARKAREALEQFGRAPTSPWNQNPYQNPTIPWNLGSPEAEDQGAPARGSEEDLNFGRGPIAAGSVFTQPQLEHFQLSPEEVIEAIDGAPLTTIEDFYTRFIKGPPIRFTVRDPATGRTRDVRINAPPPSPEDARYDAMDDALDQPIDNYVPTAEERREEADYEAIENLANVELLVLAAVPSGGGAPNSAAPRPRQQPQTLPPAEWDVAPFIAFVGGAGDYAGTATGSARGEVKTPGAFFGWYDHRNIRDGLFEVVRTDEQYATDPRTLKYYGHYRRESIVRDVKAHVKQFGRYYRTPIVLIGHSYGGNTAWHAAADLSGSEGHVDLLVTLDAVATLKSFGPPGANLMMSGNPARRWLNVFCTNNWNLGEIGDNVFDLAGRYGRKKNATRNIRVSDSHTETFQMYEHVERDILAAIQPDKNVVFVNLTNDFIAVATLDYQHDRGAISAKRLTGCTYIQPGGSLKVTRRKMYALYGSEGPLAWPQPEQAVLPIRLQSGAMDETIPAGADAAWSNANRGPDAKLAPFYKFVDGIHRITASGGKPNRFKLQQVDVPISYYSRKRKSVPAPRKSTQYPLNPPSNGQLVHFQFQRSRSKNSPVYRFWQTNHQVSAYGRTEGFKLKGTMNLVRLGGREKSYLYGTLQCFYAVPDAPRDGPMQFGLHSRPRPETQTPVEVPLDTVFRVRNDSPLPRSMTVSCILDNGRTWTSPASPPIPSGRTTQLVLSGAQGSVRRAGQGRNTVVMVAVRSPGMRGGEETVGFGAHGEIAGIPNYSWNERVVDAKKTIVIHFGAFGPPSQIQGGGGGFH